MNSIKNDDQLKQLYIAPVVTFLHVDHIEAKEFHNSQEQDPTSGPS